MKAIDPNGNRTRDPWIYAPGALPTALRGGHEFMRANYGRCHSNVARHLLGVAYAWLCSVQGS
jgi:hypothetical protein